MVVQKNNKVISRDKILRAASELFLEGGLAALSVRAIAKRAGLSTIGIYSHFDGKQGILDSLYVEGFQQVTAALDISALNGNPRENLLSVTQAYLEVADKYGAHYRLIFGEIDDGYKPSADARLAGESAFNRLLENVSVLLPEDASAVQKQQRAIQIWALVHGYVSLKNHAVSRLLEGADWHQMALQAMAELYDSFAVGVTQ